MTIEWFGWLTKPHMLTTGLDTLIMLAELCVAIGVVGVVAYLLEKK